MDLSLQASITEDESGVGIGNEQIEHSTTGDGAQRIRRSVGTAEESVSIDADILAGNDPGWLYLKNLDPTNYVELGIATTVYFARIPPGTAVLVPINPSAVAIFLKANTAACVVDGMLYER